MEGQVEAEEATNESRGLVGGGGRTDGGRESHQQVLMTCWQWWEVEVEAEGAANESRELVGRGGKSWWELREPPTSREDSLAVVKGQMEAEEATNKSS